MPKLNMHDIQLSSGLTYDSDNSNEAQVDRPIPREDSYFTDLSRLSSVERRCLAVLRRSPHQNGSVSNTVQYSRAALTLHIYIRQQSPASRTPYCPYSPEEMCRCVHSYIKTSLRMCYENRLDQEHRQIISALIEEIFYCEQELGFIFSCLGKPRTPYLESDVLYPDSKQNYQRSLYALEYYMNFVEIVPNSPEIQEIQEHAYNKLSLQRSGAFLNSPLCFPHSYPPLVLAAEVAHADAILLLLRYGANPLIRYHKHTFDGEPEKPSESALSLLVSSLNCLAFAKRRCQTADTQEILRKEEEKLVVCLQYMCRSVPRLPLISSCSPRASTLWNCPEEPSEGLTVLGEFWGRLIERGLVGVPRLQHLCRCVIRKRLCQTNRCPLPRAVNSLPLPGRLKGYIGLLHD